MPPAGDQLQAKGGNERLFLFAGGYAGLHALRGDAQDGREPMSLGDRPAPPD